LETAVTENPALSQHLRIIDALGPSPIPPLVVGRHVPVDLRQAVHDLLAAMADEEDGRSHLSHARLARFASVRDADYDPIREMARMAQTVRQFGQFPPDVLNA
jgi:phosphonate transport system substrate-binding protein